ncbi:multidrug effflux MFS transporter [Corynebacterium sp. Marseille-Q2516]
MKSDRLALSLLLALALLSASAPFATDMYLPALPAMVADLATSPAAGQLTLSTFMVGMAVGQLLVGPVSDALGRKPFLLAGALLAAVGSVAAAGAPNVAGVIGARAAAGLGSGACIVLARAVVPDIASGKAAAKAFALVMTIQGIAPVAAPVVGGVLADPLGWRGLMWILTAICVVQLVVSVVWVPESLPPQRRSPATASAVLRGFAAVCRNRQFQGYTVAFTFAFVAMFCYISASPFVLQGQMGWSAQSYSLAFAVNAVGLVLGNMVNTKLIDRADPHRITGVTVLFMLLIDAALLLAALVTTSPWVLLPLLFFGISALSIVLGNATALGTGAVRKNAGSASAVMGFAQFGLAGVVGPFMAVGSSPAVTMAVGMVASMVACALGLWWAGRAGAGATEAPRSAA